VTLDTIDENVMQVVADHVKGAVMKGIIVHTVTVTLNGQHGGADVTIEGDQDVAGLLCSATEEHEVH
jgi:hypothetical protein